MQLTPLALANINIILLLVDSGCTNCQDYVTLKLHYQSTNVAVQSSHINGFYLCYLKLRLLSQLRILRESLDGTIQSGCEVDVIVFIYSPLLLNRLFKSNKSHLIHSTSYLSPTTARTCSRPDNITQTPKQEVAVQSSSVTSHLFYDSGSTFAHSNSFSYFRKFLILRLLSLK